MSHIIRRGSPSGLGHVNISHINRASQIWLIGHARLGALSVDPGKTCPQVFCPIDWPWNTLYNVGEADDIHNGTCTFVCLDGHVEARSYKDLFANKGDVWAHDSY